MLAVASCADPTPADTPSLPEHGPGLVIVLGGTITLDNASFTALKYRAKWNHRLYNCFWLCRAPKHRFNLDFHTPVYSADLLSRCFRGEE